MVRSVIDGGLTKAAAAFNSTFRPRRSPSGSDVSARRVSMGCVIAPHGPFHCRAKPELPHALEVLRWQRHTGKQIAIEVGISPATVSHILRRLGIESIARPGTGRAGRALLTANIPAS